MDEKLIKPISPSPASVKHVVKKKHAKKEKRQRDKEKEHSPNSSSTQGKVIDDYA